MKRTCTEVRESVGDKRGRDAFSFIRSFANQDKIGWLVARAQSSGCQLRNNFLRHFGQHRWSPPPPLPPGWRDDAVSMLFEFLEDAGLVQTLDALEKETG